MDSFLDGRDGTLLLVIGQVESGIEGGGNMSHFIAPREEDFLDDESYQEALESWEWAESDYAEDSREWMRERDE